MNKSYFTLRRLIDIRLFLIIVYGLFLTLACSYIPLEVSYKPQCERLPADFSYDGFVLHFKRAPDLTQHRHQIGYDLRLRKYTDYFWDTCGGTTSAIIIMEVTHELNEHGMYLPVGSNVYSSFIKMGVTEIKENIR